MAGGLTDTDAFAAAAARAGCRSTSLTGFRHWRAAAGKDPAAGDATCSSRRRPWPGETSAGRTRSPCRCCWPGALSPLGVLTEPPTSTHRANQQPLSKAPRSPTPERDQPLGEGSTGGGASARRLRESGARAASARRACFESARPSAAGAAMGRASLPRRRTASEQRQAVRSVYSELACDAFTNHVRRSRRGGVGVRQGVQSSPEPERGRHARVEGQCIFSGPAWAETASQGCTLLVLPTSTTLPCSFFFFSSQPCPASCPRSST